MSAALYGEWKRETLVRALERARVEAEVGALIDAHGEGRRRATFHARIAEDGRERVGFMRARAHDIVAIDACPLFSPAMAGAIAAARALAGDLRGFDKPLDIQATATLGGLDFDLRGSGPLDAPARRKLVETADAARSGARVEPWRGRRRAARAASRLRAGAGDAAAGRILAGDGSGRARAG